MRWNPVLPLLAFIPTLLPGTANADYQFELAAQAWRESNPRDKYISVSDKRYTTTAKYYLSPVEDSGTPWRLAPFLQRTSVISAAWQRADYQADALDTERRSFSANVQLRESDFQLYGGVIDRSRPDDWRTYSLGTTWYASDTSTFSVGYSWLDYDDAPVNQEDWSLGYRAVHQRGDNYFALTLDVFLSNADLDLPPFTSLDIDAWNVVTGLTWYPSRHHGIGLKLIAAASEEEDVYTLPTPGEDHTRTENWLALAEYTLDLSRHFGLSIFYGSGETEYRDRHNSDSWHDARYGGDLTFRF